jgi:outer membrane protein OmpU
MTIKRILLGSSALVTAAAAAASAQATDPIKLTLGGFYGSAAGVEIGGNTSDGAPSQDRQTGAFKNNVEVWFDGVTTLDNGLSVGAHIELEANNTAKRTIDQVYTFFRGGFGDFRFGDQKSAMDSTCVLDPGYITNNFGLQSPNNSFTNVGRNAVIPIGNLSTCTDEGQSTGTKAVYISPIFSGLQFAVSYQPSNDSSGAGGSGPGGRTGGPGTGTRANSGADRNIFSGGAVYKTKVGDANLTVGAGLEYTIEGNLRTTSTENMGFYNAGFQFGFGRFTVGASGEYYQNYINCGRFNAPNATNPVANGSDAWSVSVGGKYAIDAWTIGLEYMRAQFQISSSSDVDIYNAASLQATYKVGPGIRFEGEVAWFSWNEDQRLPSPGATAQSHSWSLGLGTYMTF